MTQTYVYSAVFLPDNNPNAYLNFSLSTSLAMFYSSALYLFFVIFLPKLMAEVSKVHVLICQKYEDTFWEPSFPFYISILYFHVTYLPYP